jgi:hypothetical protein
MRKRQLGLALFSAAILLTEIALTRFYSVRYYPPVVFAILSLALLGIGLGAAMAAWWPAARRCSHTATYAGAMAFATMGLLLITTQGSGSLPEFLGWMLSLLAFILAGLAMSTLYSQWSEESPSLYWADLSGAGLGAMLATPIFSAVGVINALLLAALAAGLAAILLRACPARNLNSPVMHDGNPVSGSETSFQSWYSRSVGRVPIVATATAALLLTTNVGLDWITVDLEHLPTEKPLTQRLATGGWLVASYWDGFARTDLIDPGSMTDSAAPYEIYMDGAAGSVMPPADGHPALWRDIGFFPYATEQPQRVFIIGAGGGLDIWFALQGNAKEITAVEVNQASMRLLHDYSEYNGQIADRPEVRLIADEGRSRLVRENRSYDLISLSQVVTAAAERNGYALVENSTYTLEAFTTYLEHLTDDGVIALKLYDEITLSRALTTALAALKSRGLNDSEALAHIMVLLDTSAEPAVPLLLVRNRAYTREDSLSLGAVADQVGFAPLYLPDVWAEPPLDALVDGQTTLNQFIETAEQNLAPTTDDQPFFFQFERGIPDNLGRLLLAVSALSAALVGGTIVAGRRLHGAENGPFGARFILYFTLLGFGFIMAEVAMIQQARLFLGHPTYAITVVLATLLLGGGIGSGTIGKMTKQDNFSLVPSWPGLAVFVLMVAWALLWPPISGFAALSPVANRTALVALTLIPVGFFMGIPFPLGLRAAGRLGHRPVALAWAVNGVMSVLGSVAAITIAILAGFSMVYLTAACIYLLVAFVARGLSAK